MGRTDLTQQVPPFTSPNNEI